jgi:hypothetical protein
MRASHMTLDELHGHRALAVATVLARPARSPAGCTRVDKQLVTATRSA